MTIIEAMADPKLFGPWFVKRWASWARWVIFLKCLFGLPLDEEETNVYQHHTGRATAPTAQAREAWIAAGRRAGKSRIVALVGAYLAAFFDYRAFLDPGEFGVVVIVATDRSQARVIFSYIKAFFGVPMLRKLVAKVKDGDKIIELKNNIHIEVHAGSFRASRGFTIVCALLDEIAFWRNEEENSANPDVEIVRAIKPGMLTIPNAMMVALSSPYAQRGALWQAYRKHFAKDGDPVLVWQGTTEEMHPTVNKELIAEAYEEDADSARAEYGAEFRQDVAAYISAEALEQCIIPHRIELPPFAAGQFRAFTDPSGGMGDSFTLAIGHSETVQGKTRHIIDVVRETRAPFSPEQIIADLCGVLKHYRVTEVTGDRYAARYNSEQFVKNGITYQEAEFVRSNLYLNALALLNSGQCELPDIPRLKAQILGLDRITGRGGKDRVDHGPRGHDDIANAVLGLLAMMATTEETQPVTSSKFSFNPLEKEIDMAKSLALEALTKIISGAQHDLQKLRSINSALAEKVAAISNRKHFRDEFIQAEVGKLRAEAHAAVRDYMQRMNPMAIFTSPLLTDDYWTVPAFLHRHATTQDPILLSGAEGRNTTEIMKALLTLQRQTNTLLALPRLPLSALAAMAEQAQSQGDWALLSQVYTESEYRGETDERARMLKHGILSSAIPDVTEGKRLAQEAHRMKEMVGLCLRSIESGEPDLGLKYEEAAAIRAARDHERQAAQQQDRETLTDNLKPAA